MSLRLNKAFGVVEAVIEARSSVRDNAVLPSVITALVPTY